MRAYFCRFFTGWRVEAARIGRKIERITAFEAAVHLGQRIWRAIWPGFFLWKARSGNRGGASGEIGATEPERRFDGNATHTGIGRNWRGDRPGAAAPVRTIG